VQASACSPSFAQTCKTVLPHKSTEGRNGKIGGIVNRNLTVPLLGLLLGLAAMGAAQKKPLDHSVYDIWKSLGARSLSNDGKWVAYTVSPQEGEGKAYLKTTANQSEKSWDNANSLNFTDDNHYFLAVLSPTKAQRDAATKDKKPAPKNKLLIVDLTNGQEKVMDDVTRYTLNGEDTGWILYRPEPPEAKPEEKKDDANKEGEKKDEKPKKKATHRPGERNVLLQLATGKTIDIDDYVSGQFNDKGSVFVYVVSTKDGAGDGIVWMDLKTGEKTPVVTQLGQYPRVILHETKPMVAFMTDKDDYAAEKPGNSIYTWTKGGSLTLAADNKTPGIPEGMQIASTGALRFSGSGRRLSIALQKIPVPDPPAVPADQKVDIDIWHWQDAILQPQQLLQVAQARNRTYEAMVVVGKKNVMVLETDEIPNVGFDRDMDGRYALATSNMPYQIEASWDTTYNDGYLIDLETGARKQIYTKMDGFAGLSPNGKYVFGSNDHTAEIWIMNVATGERMVINKDLPINLYNELNDVPADASPYGFAGWGKDDDMLFIYDRFDVWSFDLAKGGKAKNATNDSGRSRHVRYRIINLDPDSKFLDPTKEQYFTAFDEQTKESGYFKGDLMGHSPSEIVLEKCSFEGLQKAKDSDTVILTRETCEVFGDLQASTLEFKNFTRLSDVNPQQKDYNWATSELVEWTSLDGDDLQGIIVKPENFDSHKKYPMVVYFYERESDNLYQHRVPAPSASTINPTYFASNGYVVFIPDIPYKTGYPGESAISAIMPGVTRVLEMGYVDPKRMGIQGQSWGGYQVAYMVTETNMFAAACAGAPVSNMFSAYGGIRWGSGLVREFQYEKTQSRIDGTIWEKPLRFLENSPIFFVDKVKTPLMIMSNDKDGSVPWYQGIEMFTAMRRLQKPCWLLVYNGEDHNLVQRKNRKDFTIRLSQFFDHYLKGDPMPVWMADGIPATEKGKNMGLGLKGEEKKEEKKGG
jgi:dipeptidyl aminopeptidase/acylaminoacyl peptidase